MFKKTQQDLEREKKKLKKLEQNQISQQKCRQTKKLKLEEICEKNPQVGEILRPRRTRGQPRIDDKQPNLLSTIVDIATVGCGIDNRRRTEGLRSCKTLKELTLQLNALLNSEISESSVDLRLRPKRANSSGGNRHVKTVPIKLVKAQTSEHKSHVDSEFCTATIRALDSFTSYPGPD